MKGGAPHGEDGEPGEGRGGIWGIGYGGGPTTLSLYGLGTKFKHERQKETKKRRKKERRKERKKERKKKERRKERKKGISTFLFLLLYDYIIILCYFYTVAYI